MSETVTPAVTASADPADEVFAWWRTMLASDPVHRDEHDVWHVFGHADVSRVLSDPGTFSSDTRAFNPTDPDIDLFARGNIVDMDPPRHRVMRALVNQVFTPRVVAGLEPRIREIAAGLLDGVGDADRFDLMDTLAYPLPVTVIAELLGVPSEDLPRFRRWAEGLFSLQDVGPSVVPSEELNAQVAPILREMNDYLLEHIRVRRSRHTDDLLGRLTTARVDGKGLDDEEVVGFAGLLLLAGHVTTTSLLGSAVLCLDRHPGAAEAVRADPTLLPGAIEEVLRFRSPFPRLGRVTRTDVRVGGRDIPAGVLVCPWVGSANRDPARFPDPGRFDITRNTGGHLTFGHGVHFCLGAPLARLEARIGLDLLMRRWRDIAVDDAGVVHNNPWVMIAVRRLPVRVAT
jgi:cytochrome P450